MHLLPRSPRGIWLLAAAVWAVACAIWWWALPVEPQVRFRPGPGIRGFTPDGQGMIKQQPPEPSSFPFTGQTFALELRSVPSDKLVANLVECAFTSSNLASSAGNRYWMLRDSDELDQQCNELLARFIKLDVVARSTQRYSIPRSVVQDRNIMDLSPDGRFCVLQDRASSARAILWDLAEGRLTTPEPDIFAPISFSNNGRYLVTQSRHQQFRIVVIDLWNGSTRAILKGPDSPPRDQLGQSQMGLSSILLSNDDVTHVAAQFFDRAVGFRLFSWNVDSGKVELEMPRTLIGFVDGGKAILASDFNARGRTVETIDLPTGKTRASFQTDANLACLLTLDGRTILAPAVEPGGSFWERSAARLGLTWPFSKSGDLVRCRLHDLATGRQFDEFPVENTAVNRVQPISVQLIPNGSVVSVEGLHPVTDYFIWDMPPRKSLSTFAIRAAILGTVIAIIAWLRQRRLRLRRAAVS